MGGGISKTMNDNMKKNQEQMQKFQKEMAMKQRQLQLATNFAIGKERFAWISAFMGIAIPGLLVRAKHTKNPSFIIPIIPFSFIWGYQWDMFYGNKMQRVRAEAERMIAEEPELFYLPKGNLIMEQEEYQQALKIQQKQNQ